MRVQSANSQANASGQAQAQAQAQATQGAGPAETSGAAPAVFDTSAHGSSNGERRASGVSPDESRPFTSNAGFGVPAHYAIEPVGRLRADAIHRGVYKDDSGAAYIRQGTQTYPVRYDKDNGTWRVHRPDRPTKYAYPVKPDDSGSWHAHGEVGVPGGWRGGAPGGMSFGHHAIGQLQQQVQQLQLQRQDLLQQRQHLQGQLHPFPGPQHANRSPLELAFLQSALSAQLANVNNQLHGVEQQLQQANQALQHLQNELPQ
ncbi:hypothetical protein PQR14_16055 [Paraburkholderia bryophila]|uniref:hypothetical protein n=2 Tax=Burkholderiaceae TaxID=119060 RepID=UPI00054E712E